jgi:hypothetical protein
MTVPPDDFMSYWAAGHLLWTGGNPYDPQQLLAVEQAVGWERQDPLQVWYPPWALVLFLPFAWMDYAVARTTWFAANAAAAVLGASLVWQHWEGGAAHRRVIVLLALLFPATVTGLVLGQLSPLLLLGLASYLCLQRRGRDGLAGATLGLLTVKPHLLYLLWPALVWNAVQTRRSGVLLGVVGAVLAATLLVGGLDPAVFQQYRAVLATHPPDWMTPTLGSGLRCLTGNSAVQFLPAAVGLCAWVAWRAKRRVDIDAEIPGLVLWSLVTTPFAWSNDHIVALVALFQPVAVWLRVGRLPGAWVAVFVALVTIQVVQRVVNPVDHWLAWTGPAWLAWWWSWRRSWRR